MQQNRLLVACTSAGLGLLFLARLAPQATSVARSGQAGLDTPYPAVAAAVLALLVWHLAPRRGWAWLLLAGALCTAVSAAVTLELVTMTEANHQWLLGIVRCAPVFTLVGVLGAATILWRSGSRATGAALSGVALALLLTGPTMVLAAEIAWEGYENVHSVLTVVLTAAGLAAAVVGVLLRNIPEQTPPRWRVTLAAAVAAAAPVVHHVWDPLSTSGRPTDYFVLLAMVLGALGLVCVAAVVGAASGVAVLLAALAAGLVLGVFGLLPLVMIYLMGGSVLPVILMLAGIVAGFLLARSRLRVAAGAGGLLVVAAGLVVIYLTEPSQDGLGPVLLAVATAAVVATGAAIGDRLAEPAAAPAALVGLATPFSLALFAYATHEWEQQVRYAYEVPNLLLVAAGALTVAALAVLGLRVRQPEPAPEEPEPALTP